MFKQAVKEKLKLRLAIEGPSGSGKTYSALLIARGLVGDSGKIAMIDTEKDSGKLYADVTIFDHAALTEPYTPDRYISIISEAGKAGYDCLIIDSISHEWSGSGGILEIHDKMPGNSYANWGKVNPRHEAFLNAILNYPGHIIVTCRSKQAYVLETNDKGKQEPKKVGMAPQQRDGIEYEFTCVLKMDRTNQADGDKDRTGLFPSGEWFTPSQETGKKLCAWLDAGVDAKPATPTPKDKGFDEYQEEIDNVCKERGSAGMAEWREKNKDDVNKMAKIDVDKFRNYFIDLFNLTKEKESSSLAPETVDCPMGGKVVPGVDCAACENKDKCEIGRGVVGSGKLNMEV